MLLCVPMCVIAAAYSAWSLRLRSSRNKFWSLTTVGSGIAIRRSAIQLILAALGFATASSAQVPLDQYQAYKIVNKFSGQVLDVVNLSTANGAQIQQWPYADGSNQKWQLIPAGGSFFEVMNVLSGRALDVTGGSTSDGTLVQQWDWLNGDNQKWQFIPVDNGQYFAIQNKLSGKVLDDTNVSANAGTRIQQYTYVGGENQKWQLVPVYVNYEIVNAWSGRVVDIYGGSPNPGTAIQQWDFLNGGNQKWQLVLTGADNYVIQSTATGQVLDDTNFSTQAGTEIQEYPYVGNSNQQWFLNSTNGSYFQIVNGLSGLSLSVASTGNGVHLKQDNFTGDVNQLWGLAVDGSLPVASSGSSVAPPAVIGISSIAYIDENHISTYSATEVDYETAAYYSSYVETCLYQDGSAITCGNQTSGTGSSSASGFLNATVSAGHHYKLQTNHYLVAAFSYESVGINYYYNPFGYGFASGGDFSVDDSSYFSASAAVYVQYADIYLGSTGVDAYTPLTEFTRGDLQGAVDSVQYNGNGTYTLGLRGPGWELGYQNGFISAGDIALTSACVAQPELCVVAAGGAIVIIYTAPKLGQAVQKIWEQWHFRKPAPFPYPGNDPSIAPGPNWEWHERERLQVETVHGQGRIPIQVADQRACIQI